MNEFNWTNVVELGHAEIDRQHKHLALLGRDVVESAVNSVDHKPDPVKLRALTDSVLEHFAFEESLMRSTGYPDTERHVKYHSSLIMEFGSYLAKMHSDQDAGPTDLINYLWSWLSVHGVSADLELFDWLKTHQPVAGK